MRKGMGKGTGKGYKNLIGVDKKIHSQSAKGIKQPQRVNPIVNKTLPKFEKIFLVSNLNTINLKDFKKEKPLSYAYLSLQNALNNSGMKLIFVNQDKNRVYFRIHNNINGYTSSITELSNKDLLSMDNYILSGLKDEVWNKTL